MVPLQRTVLRTLYLIWGLLPAVNAAAQSRSEKLAQQVNQSFPEMRVVIQTRGTLQPGKVYKALRLTPDQPVSRETLSALPQKILQWLAGEGYYLAQIDTAELRTRPSPHFFISIREGTPLRLAAIRAHLPGASQIPAALLHDLIRPRSTPALHREIRRFLTRMAERGFPFAAVHIDSVLLHSGNAYSIALRVVPGERVRIDSVEIIGNSITRKHVIERELPLKKGSLFNESLMSEIPSRLMRLGFFKSVSPPELLIHGAGKGIIRFRVEEGNTNLFNGVIGYNPGTGNSPGYFTGLLDLKFRNLLGTGRQISAFWEKRTRNTQELALRFKEPWLLGWPVHLEGGFQQIIQDTLYIRRNLDFKVQWPLVDKMEVIGRLSRYSVSPDSTGLRLSIPPSKALSAGVGLSYASTDDPYNPRQGAEFHTLLETISKQITPLDGNASIYRQRRVSVDAAWYLPIRRFQVLSVAMHWRQVTSTEPVVSITDQFRFGGARTLRGYREEQFRGSRVAWMNLEYRYLLGPRSRAFVFYDLGYFYRIEDNLEKVENLKQGYGIGVRLETRLGMIGLDYGLGEGDKWLQGKIHLSLTNTF